MCIKLTPGKLTLRNQNIDPQGKLTHGKLTHGKWTYRNRPVNIDPQETDPQGKLTHGKWKLIPNGNSQHRITQNKVVAVMSNGVAVTSSPLGHTSYNCDTEYTYQ